ncbi:MAG: DUF4157 domain-containing protein, partial [Cytophagaceae bacterium]
AYAQGNDIHFAPGQYNPETQSGQELLGHELTHVVQQRQGRVQGTTQTKGLAVNDDTALEHEADVMGKKAASGEVIKKSFYNQPQGEQISYIAQLTPDVNSVQIESAIEFNNGLNLKAQTVRIVQFLLGVNPTGSFNRDTIIAIAQFNHNNHLENLSGQLREAEFAESINSLIGPLSVEQVLCLNNAERLESPENIREQIRNSQNQFAATDGQLDTATFANLFSRTVSLGQQQYALLLAVDYYNLENDSIVSINYSNEVPGLFNLNVPFSNIVLTDGSALMNNQITITGAPNTLKKITLGDFAFESLELFRAAFNLIRNIQYLPANSETQNANLVDDTTLEPLSQEQMNLASAHNNFILSDIVSRSLVQIALGAPLSAQFDVSSVNHLRVFQVSNNLNRTDGRLDFDTIDLIVRNMIERGEREGVLRIASDFYNIGEHQLAIILNSSAIGNEAFEQNDEIDGVKNIDFGDSAFLNGLTGIAEVLETAVGSEVTFNARLADVLFAGNNALNPTRRNAMWENPNTQQQSGVVPWVHEQFPDEDVIRRYLSRTDLTDDEKIAALGQLSIELGWLEFLMGVLFYGGSNQSWENAGNNNQGAFINRYKSTVGNNPNNLPWCTMFSGYLQRMIGFNESLSTQGPLIFNAGRRLDNWATQGINLITGVDDFSDPSDFENYSGASINRQNWINLRNSLNTPGATQEQRQTFLNEFLQNRVTPQAGDIMVVTSTGNNTYGANSSSHTVVVESFNNNLITTIEGNRGHRVTGTSINLLDSTDVSNILLLKRIGLEFFPSNLENDNQVEGQEEENGIEQIDAENLLNPLRFISRNLQLLAAQKNFISSSENGALVEEMVGNNNAGGTF